MIDLHCHTKISDNSMTIEEVIELARQDGVEVLSINDHDTTLGLEQAQRVGQELGVQIIPGIEISGYDFERSRRVHILGFHVKPGHAAISALCDPLIARRQAASHQMVEQLIEAGYGISWEQVQRYAEGGTGVYKQHIMHALIDQGYTTTIYGELYRTLFARGGNGTAPGAAYIPLTYLDARDAVYAIREAGGVPVLAHPHQYDSWDMLPALIDSGLAGIEVRHPTHGEAEEKKAMEIAERYGLIPTGGSDFHGFYGETELYTLGSKSPGMASVERLAAYAGEYL